MLISGATSDDHHRAHRVAVTYRVRDRVESAHRLPDQDRTLESQSIDESLDVTNVRSDSIVSHRRPFAIAMPALVERNASEAIAKHHRHAIPCVRSQTTAVQEQNRGAGSTPIEIVKAHRTDDHPADRQAA